LPMMLYQEMRFGAPSGLHELIMVSKSDGLTAFATALSAMGELARQQTISGLSAPEAGTEVEP